MALKPIRYPLINGVRASMASTELEITSDLLTWKTKGWSKLDFDRTRDRGEVRGPHPDPIAMTRGQNKYTGSMTLYLAELNYLKQVVLGGPGYGDRFFRIVLQYLENGQDVVKVELRSCKLDKDAVSNAIGTDATQVEIDLHPLKIIWNDQDDVDDPLAA
jgi:hypothetical protein